GRPGRRALDREDHRRAAPRADRAADRRGRAGPKERPRLSRILTSARRVQANRRAPAALWRVEERFRLSGPSERFKRADRSFNLSLSHVAILGHATDVATHTRLLPVRTVRSAFPPAGRTCFCSRVTFSCAPQARGLVAPAARGLASRSNLALSLALPARA